MISTAPSGVAAVRARRRPPGRRRQPSRTSPGPRRREVTSLLFLDFTELLRLGEQTGLGDSRAYQAVRDDLRKVRAVGAWSSGDGDESTAEINLSIP